MTDEQLAALMSAVAPKPRQSIPTWAIGIAGTLASLLVIVVGIGISWGVLSSRVDVAGEQQRALAGIPTQLATVMSELGNLRRDYERVAGEIAKLQTRTKDRYYRSDAEGAHRAASQDRDDIRHELSELRREVRAVPGAKAP